MCHKPDISTIYPSKTDISAIYRSSSISCQTSPISDISEVDIVSNITNIGYIGDISTDISDIFIPAQNMYLKELNREMNDIDEVRPGFRHGFLEAKSTVVYSS